ncbi:hypothetical protein BpHYR1_037426 [Brachionus plicatilis]|uniref:Uncharacterized protein n=1 Tax=Brachionus plicatilis TaxID=10195 RepID=A0A3M7Q1D3_BRAPC|nr:hypothetical protein BpHYR1_037426 [Brachionus plicatilis]
MQRLNKQVLNGFIQQAISHNKYLEEQEMWKKKEPSLSNKRKKRHKSCEKNPKFKSPSPSDDEIKEDKPKSSRTPEELDDLKAILALYKSAKETNGEKWGHSGFQELYPDSKQSANENKKISIDNRLELINETKKDEYRKSKKKTKKTKKHRNFDDSSDTDKSSDSYSSDCDDSKKRRYKKKSKKRKK